MTETAQAPVEQAAPPVFTPDSPPPAGDVAAALEAAKAPPEPPPPAHDPDVLVAAAKAEREARELRTRLKTQHKELEDERARVAQLAKLAKEDPYAFLSQSGEPDWYAKVTDRILSDGKVPKELAKPKDALEEVKEELRKMQQAQSQYQAQQQAQAYYSSVDTILGSDSKYELLTADPTALNEMYAYAQGYAQKTGELLPPEKLVGTVYEAQVERLRQLAKSKAWEALGVAMVSQPPAVKAPQAKQNKAQQAAGVVDQAPARGVPPEEQVFDPLDEAAQFARAIAAIQAAKAGA